MPKPCIEPEFGLPVCVSPGRKDKFSHDEALIMSKNLCSFSPLLNLVLTMQKKNNNKHWACLKTLSIELCMDYAWIRQTQ